MAVISGCSHLYVTCSFAATQSSGWVGETWQFGLRVAVSSSSLSPSSGVVNLSPFSVQDASVTRTYSTYDVEQAWSGVTVGGNTITDADQDKIVDAITVPIRVYKDRFTTRYNLDHVKIYAVRPGPANKWLSGAPNAYYPQGVVTGTNAGMEAPDVACAVSLYTATRGVKGRGRVYLGGLGAGTVGSGGKFEHVARNELADAIATTIDNIRAIGTPTSMHFSPIVWHRPGDKYGVEDGLRGSVISRVEANDIADTQRRRDHQGQPDWYQVQIT